MFSHVEAQFVVFLQEDSIVDANEDDQLQAAIKASLTEVTVPAKADNNSDSGSDSELETFSDSDEDSRHSPIKTRRMSASETLRKTNRSAKNGSPLRTEVPCSSRSEKRESPLRKGRESPSVSRRENSGSPAPKTDKPHSPALRKSARNSPLRTDGSDSDPSNHTPKKVCTPKRTGSPLTKSSPFKSSSASVKDSPQRNSPQRKVQKSDSIHNEVHPAVFDNIQRSLDNDDKETSEVNASVSSASEVSDLSKHDDSLDIPAVDSRDYLKYLGKDSGKARVF